MSAAVPFENPWTFAQSQSKAVGVGGGAMNVLRNNAPRIVGGLKLAGDLTVGLSLNPFLMAYSAFAMTGRVVLMVYGSKANQKSALDAKEKSDKPAAEPGIIGKIIHPKQYPVESSAGLSTIAELCGVGYGVSQFVSGTDAYTPVILGLIATWSYANIFFGKEKKAEDKEKPKTDSLTFAKSESQTVGGFFSKLKGYMKDNPVLVSSVVQIGVMMAYVAGSFTEGLDSFHTYALAAGFFISATLLQAAFVRKNDFNVEGAKNDAKPDTKPDVKQVQAFAPRQGEIGAQPA